MVFIFSILVALGAFAFWRSILRRDKQGHYPGLRMAGSVVFGLMVIFILVAASQFIRVIPAGHVGVVDFFGTVNDRPIYAGINLVNPLAKVVKFSVQTKEEKEQMQVLSREGLTIGLEISVLYRLNPDSAVSVYKTVAGGDYETIILVPQFRSASRAITAGYQASALYSTERDQLANAIQQDLSKAIASRGVIIESTPLRNVSLPPQLTEAIEQKQRADQESQRMEFVLTKEKQEADRKRIEAQGIADFQKIVSSGISEQLLRWKGVEATEKLANSANTKVIIVGSGKDGLPVILDTK